MDHIPRLSEVLYIGLCREIGTPTEVAIRRDVLDIEERIKSPLYMHIGFILMDSGSYREGFRFTSSDRDRMLWLCNCKLITDICHFRIYNSSKHQIILMEDSETPPGFVRLRLLTPNYAQSSFINSCLVAFNGGLYISSSLTRNTFFNLLTGNRFSSYKNKTIHGPCTNGFFKSVEVDHALCFAIICCNKFLRNLVERCQRHAWPPVPVLEKILRNGCHCVPIGSKLDSPYNELEWRLSFSLAEQQLVCTMNHTQFLCYGLLKIFLKEVMNNRQEPILCSYYMKTTVFWIMQLGHVNWHPINFLDCFWKCFKYLIHFVYRGEFSNFFIPENNMFLNKVVGDTRESLLQQLYQYYRMGVSCLLLSPTLRSILEPALCNLSFAVSFTENITDINLCGMQEILGLSFRIEELCHCYLYLTSIDKLSRLSILPYQLLTLQYCTAETLVKLAFIMANSTSGYTHKNIYILDRMICNMLKLVAKLGPASYSLYLALYYYRTGRYDKTLLITFLTKRRLSQDFVIYYSKPAVDWHSYNEALGNLSLSRRMTMTWVCNVRISDNNPCIEELIFEQSVIQQNGFPILEISPFVMVEMLSVLSHYRLGNRSQCLQSRTDLQTLLLYDDGTYVPLKFIDISWQILGICQHIIGDLHGALQSYQESLKQEAYHGIQEATYIRIEWVKEQLDRNT
ncbi:uncharacterized protein LOC133188284 [Saccostrea echinata]|uniref:uncharacterized protein LOC133188284 n=1 Tax=Saccostrea echinata TaxID=191078 RepID=UPI002A82D30F|nr:uncharacterized protein LOC133188284 [Saccostrea echinata]